MNLCTALNFEMISLWCLAFVVFICIFIVISQYVTKCEMSQSAKCNTGRHLMSLKLYVSKLALFKLYFFKSKSYFKEMGIYFCELKMYFFELKIYFFKLKMYLCEFKLYLSKCVPICRLCIDRKLWMYEENRWYGFKSPGVW